MQTLKTAAIVVLLMTVMYGAYVSLTTPPEPLPVSVEEMLVISEEGTFAIDAGLPPGLGELEINSGTASAGIDSTALDLPLPDGPVDSTTTGDALANGASAVLSDSAAMASAFDAQASGVAANETGVTSHLSDALPVEASLNDMASASSPRSYPRTSNTFDLPDPNDVESSFTGTPGGVDLPQADLALANGVDGPNSTDVPPTEQAISQASAIDATGASGASDLGLSNAIRTADEQYAQDKRKEALATLSIFYNTPNLSGEQRSELLSRLDPLARDVIYSRRHLLEQPHRVGQNETLMQVAARYEVPWQLLANINQVKDPVTVLPGTELKVVRGPFHADVNLATKELTLFLGDLYAGRFPIGVGNDPAPKPGTYTVQDKQVSRTFYDAAGSPVPPGSPNNPYGEVWLDLGGQLCIHGSPSTTNPTDKGCVSLAADYADDLYGILSQGSSVTIRR